MLLMHPQAKLTDADRATIETWARETAAGLPPTME